MGVVLRTEDGGRRWRRVLAGAESTEPHQHPLLHVALMADGSLIALGAYGLALTSADGGRTWTALELSNPEKFTLYGYAQRGGEQWLFGEQGFILRADSSTGRFAPSVASIPATLFCGLALRGGALLLGGLRGRILRSAAPGTPFEEVSTPIDASIFGGLQLDDGVVVLVGAAGQVLISRDAGQRFKSVALPSRFPFSGLATAPEGELVLVGQRGLLRVDAPS
jgi:photosystem II stability/assembly factor-like uncharacterized protein